jgi:FdhD protein
MARTTVRQRVVRVALDGRWAVRPATLAVEEPLEIRVDEAPFTVTMRTPATTLTWRWASWSPRGR